MSVESRSTCPAGRSLEGIRQVAELSLSHGDAGAVVADVDLDEDRNSARPGVLRDGFEHPHVLRVVDEERDGVWA